LKKLSIFIGIIVILSMVLMSCGKTSTTPTQTSKPPTSTTSVSTPTSTASPTLEYPWSTVPSSGLTPKSGGTLKIIVGAPSNLGGVPWLGNTPPDLWYACPVTETLLITDVKGNLAPRLATSWTVAPDYKSITFKLKEGVRFHDGTDFNAEALKYLFEMNAKSTMPELKSITSVDVVDTYTAKVNVTLYSPSMMTLLAVGRAGWIVSPTALKSAAKLEDMMLNPVGTGPFKFQEYKRDVYVKFVKNNDYWQPGKPYLDGIEYQIIADSVTALLTFRKGDADVNYNVVQKDAYDLKGEGYNVTSAQASIYQWAPSSADPNSPWANVDVRRAVQYAIDTQTMAKTQGFGWADGYYNQVFPKGNPAYNPDIVGYPYDPAKAKELLAKAGYADGFKTTLFDTSPPVGDLAAATQNYLKQVGIDAEIKPLPGPAYFEANLKGWDGLFRTQSVASLGADPGYQMSIYLSSPPTAWVSVARPADMTALLTAATNELDLPKRQALYRDLCKNIIDTNCLIISVWGGYLLAAKQKYVMDDNIRTLWTMTWTPETAWLNK
jgi:peptide/nickel transport system substrate-binding protein